jgi:hypothetical protein
MCIFKNDLKLMKLVVYCFLFCLFPVSSSSSSSDPPPSSIWDLISYISATPPKVSKAEKLCKEGRLPRAKDTAITPVSMGGAKTLDVFVLRRLAYSAEMINVIACLVDNDVIEVNQTVDGGAALLIAAVEKKHVRLTTSLLMRNATRPVNIISEAISNRLIVLEITQNLLMKNLVRKSLSPPLETMEYAKWLAGMVSSFEQHLPITEAKKPATAFVALLKNSNVVTAFFNSSNSRNTGAQVLVSPKTLKKPSTNLSLSLLDTADIEHVSIIANCLSSILVSVLTSPLNAPSSSKETSSKGLLFYQDARGRTPLHHAAAHGNKPAAITMINVLLRDTGKEIAMQEWLSMRDVAGFTSAELACIYGHVSFAWYLYNGGGEDGDVSEKKMDPKFCEKIVNSYSETKKKKKTKTLKNGKNVISDEEEEEEEEEEENDESIDSLITPSLVDTNSVNENDTGGWLSSYTNLPQDGYDSLRAVEKNLLTRHNKLIKQNDKNNLTEKKDHILLPSSFSLYKTDCDVDVISANEFTSKYFYTKAYSVNRPLLIRGLALDWKIRSLFTKEALLSRNSSNAIFFPSTSPFGRPFHEVSISANRAGKGRRGEKGNRFNTTLSDFIHSLTDISEDKLSLDSSPLYIYEPLKVTTRGKNNIESDEDYTHMSIIEGFELIPSFLRFEIPGLQETTQASIEQVKRAITSKSKSISKSKSSKKLSQVSSIYSNRTGLVLSRPSPTPQFYLGGPGSGSPLHIHKDAFNTLMYGKKRWFLISPASALYSTVPISTWVVNTSLDGPKAPKGLQMCTQNAGDVLYIPHGWAHGVLNLETSVGVAVEFSSILQE